MPPPRKKQSTGCSANEQDIHQDISDQVKQEPSPTAGRIGFRHRWQKNPTRKKDAPTAPGHRDNERAYRPTQGGKQPSKQLLISEGSIEGRATRRRNSQDLNAFDDNESNSSNDRVVFRGDDGYSSDGYGSEDQDEDDCDISYNVAGDPVFVPNKGKKARKIKQDKKEKVPHPNGRVDGRNLVLWHRPRMVEKLLLHLIYESHLSGIKLPWAATVKRLNPGSSGMCAVQHLHKLRDILITEGHLVPPLMGKKTKSLNYNVRGFVRDMDGPMPTSVQPLSWDEKYEDRTENLNIDGIVHGSGNYNRETSLKKGKATSKGSRPADGIRRTRRSRAQQAAAEKQRKVERRVTRNFQKLAHNKNTATQSVEDAEDDEDDDDDEYDPDTGLDVERKKTRRSNRKKNPDETDDEDDEIVGLVRDSLEVTLKLPSSILEQFPPGESGFGMSEFTANTPAKTNDHNLHTLTGNFVTQQYCPSVEATRSQIPLEAQVPAATYRSMPDPRLQNRVGLAGESSGAFGGLQTMPASYNAGHGNATNFTFQAGSSFDSQTGDASGNQFGPSAYRSGSGYRSGTLPRYQPSSEHLYSGQMQSYPSMDTTPMTYGGGNSFGMNGYDYSANFAEPMSYSYNLEHSTPYGGLGSGSGFASRPVSNNSGSPFAIAADQTATLRGTNQSLVPTGVTSQDSLPRLANSVVSSRFATTKAEKDNVTEEDFIALLGGSGNDDDKDWIGSMW